MRIIQPGHVYAVEEFENKGEQVITFIQKEPIEEGSTELKLVNDGTTNEEVLAVLIDRINFLQEKAPCQENKQAIRNLGEALKWLNRRTEGRVARGVEGTSAE
jgi:hypothetical protein